MQAIEFTKGTLSFQENARYTHDTSNEALIRVIYAGICSTDLEIVKGYMDFEGIPGHEFVGIVEKSPDPFWVGKRVVGSINVACQKCLTCQRLGPEHCSNRSVLGIFRKDGAFAEYLTLPVTNLHEVPEAVEDKEAVFTEPLAAALRIYEQISISPNLPIAVVGPGRLGLLIAQTLKVHGCNLVVLGRNDSSRNFVESLGIEYNLSTEFTDNSFDIVVEATGNPQGFEQSLRLAKPKGTIILKSTFAKNSPIDLSKIVISELTLTGSRCGPFPPALRLLQAKSIKTSPLIEAEYSFRDAIAAFEHASQPGAKKILLHP